MLMLTKTAHNHQRMEKAKAALVYLGIVMTFAGVSAIGCLVWLLIW